MLDLQFFEAIGFPNNGLDELRPFLDLAIENGFKPASARGHYVYWPLGNGAEVWIALDRKRNIVNFDPHFVGKNRVAVRLEESYDAAQDLAGWIKVWTNPRGEKGKRSFPLVANIPNWDFVWSEFARRSDLQRRLRIQKPEIFDLQICAFAQTMSSFGNESQYLAAQKSEKPFAVGHFVPTGLWVENEDELPAPQAAFSGTVLDGGILTNPQTGVKTLHLAVQTLEMVLDVVANPRLVKGRPQRGGIVSGSFFLSARPLFDLEGTARWIENERSG